MPGIARSVVALRIFGDSVIPDEVSALIGCLPTRSYRKGQVQHGSRKEYVRKTGMWLLQVDDREPEDLNAQVAELLARLTPDLTMWEHLSQQYELDLFCGLFMDESNEGIALSVPTLVALAARSIEIDFDVYAPSCEIQLSEPCPCGSGKTYGECCASNQPEA